MSFGDVIDERILRLEEEKRRNIEAYAQDSFEDKQDLDNLVYKTGMIEAKIKELKDVRDEWERYSRED